MHAKCSGSNRQGGLSYEVVYPSPRDEVQAFPGVERVPRAKGKGPGTHKVQDAFVAVVPGKRSCDGGFPAPGPGLDQETFLSRLCYQRIIQVRAVEMCHFKIICLSRRLEAE